MIVMNDIASMILEELKTLMQEYASILAYMLPRMLGATLVLLIGWILGRILGKVVQAVMKLSKVDDAVSETPMGKRLKEIGYPLSRLMDLVARIAVYLFSIGMAIKVIEYPEAVQIAQSLLSLVGRLVSGVVVLVVGLFAVEKIMSIASKLVEEDGSTTSFMLDAAHAVLLAMVFLASLSQMGVDLTPLATLTVAVAWGVGIGVGLSIVVFMVATFREELYRLARILTGYKHSKVDKSEK